MQSAGSGRPHVHQHRQKVGAGPAVVRVVHRVVIFAVDAAVNGMDQPVAQPCFGAHQERGRKNPLAGRQEDGIDRIVHSTGHHRLDLAAIGPGAEDVRRPRGERPPFGQGVGLLGEGPFAPVDPAIRAEVRPVQVVGTASQRPAVEPDLPPVGHAVAVGVGQLPDFRRSRHIDAAGIPHHAFGKGQGVGERLRAVITAVAIDIFQSHDPMGRFLCLNVRLLDRSGRFRHIQPALLIQVGHDRPLDERRSGRPHDREPRRQRERLAVQRHLDGGRRRLAENLPHGQQQPASHGLDGTGASHRLAPKRGL